MVWRQILQRLADETNARKRDRILNACACVISDVYYGYKRIASPRSWSTLPNADQSHVLEPFSSLYNSETDAPLDCAACADSISQLPVNISRWSNELRHKLASFVLILHSTANRTRRWATYPSDEPQAGCVGVCVFRMLLVLGLAGTI